MKQFVLISPKIDKHKCGVTPVMDADESDSVIVYFFFRQLLLGNSSRGAQQGRARQFSLTGDAVKLHPPSNASPAWTGSE